MATHITVAELDRWVARFMRMHHKTMRRYFHSIGMFNGHPHMLFHIRHTPGITQKELAAHLDVSPASVAISIRRLESAGLICRRRDEKDGRVMHLYLTDAGAEVDATCAKGKDFMIHTAYRGLTQEEQDTLHRVLQKMIDNLQDACASLPVKGEDDL